MAKKPVALIKHVVTFTILAKPEGTHDVEGFLRIGLSHLECGGDYIGKITASKVIPLDRAQAKVELAAIGDPVRMVMGLASRGRRSRRKA
jgi:hypothetical protein